ncbi:MAG: SUMF1/EgtB/PvdO family nonheme iron enzyme, partial [Anaerolineae bacterium]|nr:SUMF1/EgtB/PvdO family nonheme iron enzyme [Anaerolineae bacterium]
RDGPEYPVTVLRSPAGEARERAEFPFGELELENRLQALQIALLRTGSVLRQVLTPEEQAVQAFGCALFEMLLCGEVRSRYDVSLREAAAQGKGLRIKLRVLPPELAVLPWEFIYDPRNAEYVCLSRNTPLVRYLELPQSVQPLRTELPLRILGMAVSPEGLPPLDIAQEKQRVETALEGLRATGLVTLNWLEGQTWRDLQRGMRHGPWHFFHFIGHGGFSRTMDEGFVALADESGEAHHLSATQLGRLLADHRDLRLALLNACEGARGSTQDIFSATAAILIRRGLPAVLAMQYPITDRAAIEFSRTFYEALADGLAVDTATTEARQAISYVAPHSVEWGIPVLYMRATDGVLFDVQVGQGQRQPQPIVPDLIPQGIVSDIGKPVREQLPAPVTPNGFDVSYVKESPTAPLLDVELVYIPPGDFVMGSDPRQDEFVQDEELPQHTLTLPEYYLARTPVTNRQYLTFVQVCGYRRPEHWPSSVIKPDDFPENQANHPVTNVTWYDAMAYCEWLTEQLRVEECQVKVWRAEQWETIGINGKAWRFHLPSEAEWEKAARGTDGRLYPWGNLWDAKRCSTKESRSVATTPVDAYPLGASPYGVLDMAGNVWEWTRTIWGVDVLKALFTYPYNSADGREDEEVSKPMHRVLRGGSYNYERDAARCASRNRLMPDHGVWYVGFRMALCAISLP